MSVWALGDLHLAISVPAKTMEVFGPSWKHYHERIADHWTDTVQAADLVLLPGDICWATHLDQAVQDLQWIDQLPGTKVMIRGNHDYWWSSLSKMKKVLPPSLHCIQNSVFNWQGLSIGGARLWDTPEYDFSPYIEMKENPKQREKNEDLEQQEKIFTRDLSRLELSLQALDPKAEKRLAMTHYPPVGADLENSRASQILEKYQVDICCFGHLHSVRPGTLPFGEKNGVNYVFTSADYVDFTPVRIL